MARIIARPPGGPPGSCRALFRRGSWRGMVRALDAEPVLTRSPYPALSIPDVSVPELLLGPMRARGSRPALVESETGRAVASAELVEQAERAAAGLASRRLRRGDVAA